MVTIVSDSNVRDPYKNILLNISAASWPGEHFKADGSPTGATDQTSTCKRGGAELKKNILSASKHKLHNIALHFWKSLKYFVIPIACLQASHTHIHMHTVLVKHTLMENP